MMSIRDRAKPILKAANSWKQSCLLDAGSVFSDEDLWTPAGFQALDRYFVQNLDTGSGDFFQKLKEQLSPAPDEAKKLAAELLWVMYLLLSQESIAGEKKRDQIKRVWAWAGDILDDDLWVLGEVLEAGVSNPGIGYHTHRWRELRFFITAMSDWFALPKNRRRDLLSDPWGFAKWLDEREWVKGRQLRHILLYLLFPRSFERALTVGHKRQIVAAFRSSLEEGAEINLTDLLSLDQHLLEIRRKLEAEAPDQEVDFYAKPFSTKWASETHSSRPRDSDSSEYSALVVAEDDEEWFEKEFGEAATPWVISAGVGGRMWAEFREKKIAAVGPDDLGDLLEYENRSEIHDGLASTTGRDNPVNDSLALWQFSREIKQGDVLIAKQGRTRVLGYGIVSGDYFYDPSRIEYQNAIEVKWKEAKAIDVATGHGYPTKTLTLARDSKAWFAGLIRLLEGQGLEVKKSSSRRLEQSYTIEDALDGLFLEQADLSSILNTISRRKNLILQGPPGVGKTFVAKRIAWTLIRAIRPEQIEMVQLHQSYSYEDFVQGWRPTRSGGFELRNGPFYSFCKRAEQSDDKSHVFIIDEINRGNLSRIFGELLMLIEADKRGRNNEIPLIYSPEGESFSVPENIYILGLMNTADRSLAMVDYALRRRFAFVTLQPAFGSQAFRDYLRAAGADENLIDFIESRLTALNEEIRSDIRNLGPGFEVGHSYFVPSDADESLDRAWYQEIVKTQIAPLLREYWFDQADKVESALADLEA